MIELDIEKIVIQKLISDEHYINEVSEKFFSVPIAKHIFNHIKKIANSDSRIVPETIAMNAQTDKFKLFDIFQYCNVGNAHIESPRYYINFLKEKYFKEKLTTKLMKGLQDLSDPQNDFFETFGIIEKFKNEIEEEIKEENTSLQSGLNDAIEEMFIRVDNFRNKRKGTTLGYKEVDNLITLESGNVFVLAARPSMGKTSLANNFALNLSRNEKSVLYLSLEVSATSLSNRMLLSENSSVEFGKFKHGSLTDDEIQNIESSLNKFDNLSLRIIDGQSNINTISKNIAVDKQRNNTDVVIIDYLQLIRSEKGYNENEKLTNISATLKELAIKNNVSIILLSQLSRDSEKRGGDRYMLSDLRGSGSIEQDADIIAFIWNGFIIDKKSGVDGFEDTPDNRKMQLQILKNRNGEIGDVELYFNKTVSKFYDNLDNSLNEEENLPF